MAAAVRTVSALADALDRVESDDTEMNNSKQELRGKFVDVLDQIPMNSMTAVTQVSTALQKVLGTEYDTVDDEGANKAANVIEDITIKLFD
ncbi:unnamed protein product, partial [Timema podura]|nr:unnamed protein product [Timema podura]